MKQQPIQKCYNVTYCRYDKKIDKITMQFSVYIVKQSIQYHLYEK